jgi:Holliday junction resolvase RusA-like endonuclease
MISIELYGDPVPQARPRIVRGGRHSYDPKAKIKEGYKWQIKSQYREEVLLPPLCADLIFFMPIPKSTSKLKRRQMLNGTIPHMKKPDLDNMIKFVFDCMNGLVFQDDSQISELRAKKIYSESPGTLIRLIPLADDNRELLYENSTRSL